MEQTATIFNIQKYNLYDGPGLRTLVFFQGCPLRCKWCANPEGLERRPRLMFKSASCVDCAACVVACPQGLHRLNEAGKHEVVRNRDHLCTGCGKCVSACLQNALSIVGQTRTITELVEEIQEDEIFYEVSGGGVTLGGGEVLAQPKAASALLKACKRNGIHTAIETCGFARKDDLLMVAEYVDLFLFDLKHLDPVRHKELTGVPNDWILDNLKTLLQLGKQVKIRMPLLKGINDSHDEIVAVIQLLYPYKELPNFQGIDLLPYHKLGVNKYQQLGKVYPIEGDPSLTDDDLDRLEQWIRQYDLPVNVMRH